MRKQDVNSSARFKTPRAAAEETGLSIKFIRDGCRAGTIPHIMVGHDFRIDMLTWADQLTDQAKARCEFFAD